MVSFGSSFQNTANNRSLNNISILCKKSTESTLDFSPFESITLGYGGVSNNGITERCVESPLVLDCIK